MDKSTEGFLHDGVNYEDVEVRRRKKKQHHSRPSTSQMVHNAITQIGSKEKGASVQKIKKYIYANYKVNLNKIDLFINKYMKKGVRDGRLIKSTGFRNGAIGFFKIAAKPKPDFSEKRILTPEKRKRKRLEKQVPVISQVVSEGEIDSSNSSNSQLSPVSSFTTVMDLIDDVSLQPLTSSQFVNPLRMHYKQNDIEKIWDLVSLHESVSIIIFNVDKQKLILVRQFRPAVYYSGIPPEERASSTINTAKYPGIRGLTLEFCAGIVDKSKELVQIAREEVLEECGYDVPLEHFEKVITYRSGVGVSGDRQTMFYVEVTNNMKVTEGGGLAAEGEMIEVVELSLAELKVLLKQSEVNCPGGLLFGLMWFLQHKAPQE